jgi:hypothetical protein
VDDERYAGDLRCLLPAEQLLQLGGEYGLLAGVVDPDPGAARDGDPLRGDLVETGRALPRQQAAQRGLHVEALQVGPSPRGPRQVQRLEQRRVIHRGPGRAEGPVAEREPRP